MKNLPLWTKTLAVASLAAFGAVACDSGQEQTADTGTAQEQDQGVVQDQGGGFDQGQDATMQEQDTDLYGQQSDATSGQGMQEGTQSDDQLSGQPQTGDTADDRVAQD